MTIGVNYNIKFINLKKGNKIRLWILDISGQERFRSVGYYRKTDYFILWYDVTVRESFENIRNWWFKDVLEFINYKPKGYLIGNKIDLCDKREVTEEEGRALANELNLHFFEISCKDDIGIDEFYDDLINDILRYF